MTALQYSIAKNAKAFDRAFQESAISVAFGSKAEEELYAEKDGVLIQKIKETFEALFPEPHEALVHHIEDWWPCQTRYIECTSDVIDQSTLKSLRELLTEDYEDWRIQLVVYRDLMDGTTKVGSIVVFNDWLLLDEPCLPLTKKEKS